MIELPFCPIKFDETRYENRFFVIAFRKSMLELLMLVARPLPIVETYYVLST